MPRAARSDWLPGGTGFRRACYMIGLLLQRRKPLHCRRPRAGVHPVGHGGWDEHSKATGAVPSRSACRTARGSKWARGGRSSAIARAAGNKSRDMITLAPGTKVYRACAPIDLRAGFNGPATKAQQAAVSSASITSAVGGSSVHAAELALDAALRQTAPPSLCCFRPSGVVSGWPSPRSLARGPNPRVARDAAPPRRRRGQ